MANFFGWLDSHPAAYWLTGAMVLGLVLAWLRRAWRETDPRAGSPMLERTLPWLILAVLLAGRWPALLQTRGNGPMEAQLVAAAMTMATAPTPLRAADPLGCGPLAALALLPTHRLGMAQDYFNARLVALLLDWAACYAAYRWLRRRTAPAPALLAAWPLLFWFAASPEPAIAAYASDHLGLALAMVGGWWLSESTRPAGGSIRSTATWVGAGLCLGALPWVSRGWWVIAAGVWLAVTVVAWSGERAQRRQRWSGPLRAGALVIYLEVAMLAWLHGAKQFDLFVEGYRGDAMPPLDPDLSASPVFWIGLLLAPVVAVAWRFFARAGGRTLVALAAGLWAVPVALWVGQGTPPIFGHLRDNWTEPYSEMGLKIRQYRQRGDTLAVWGCRPQLYVETRLPQATASGISVRELVPSPRRDNYFVPAYLAGLRLTRPAIFVDAVGPGARLFNDQARQGHEIYPELADFVRRSYRLVATDGQARLYVRFARIAEVSLAGSGKMPINLAGMREAHALAVVVETDGHISAHAPSKLVHHVPAGATRLRGEFGFLEGAYADPKAGTNGATFSVDYVAPNGHREELFSRQLQPATEPADRGQMEFEVELPPHPDGGIEFLIDPDGSAAFDWTYWSNLVFEAVGPPKAAEPGQPRPDATKRD